MMGVRPIAKQIARTRSSITDLVHPEYQVEQNRQTDITIRWTHSGGGDTQDHLDRFASPTQLRHNLLIRERCQVLMAPCVHANFMPSHVLFLQNVGALDDTRTDHEEGSMKLFLGQVVQQRPEMEDTSGHDHRKD